MIIFNEGIKSKRLTYKKNQLLHNVCMGQTITLLPPGKFPFHSEKRTMTSVRVPITCLLVLQVNPKMASGGAVELFFAVIFACLFEQVSAFDGGDAAALIIGLIIGIMGICACLGAYARRQQGV